MTAPKTPTLISLGDAIKESAASLQHLLSFNHLPQPSFDPEGRRDWSDCHFCPDILTARSNLIDAAQTLLNLAFGPTDTLAAYAGPRASELEVLRTFDALGVADAVPLDGDISIPDLALKIGIKNEAAFQKQLSFAYLMGMFRPTEGDKVAHTALSAAMPAESPWISLRLGKLFNQGAYEVANVLRTETGAGDSNIACAVADPKALYRTCYEQL